MIAGIRPPVVKVCGITNADDAHHAVAAGATALGFIAWPKSPRAIEPGPAAAIAEALPAEIARVLVVVDEPPERAIAMARALGATHVQLCGDESPGAFREFDLPLIRKISVDEKAEAQLEAWTGIAAAFLLDSPKAPGGTGELIDLVRARALAARAPCILAGGLDGERVAQAIADVKPDGVDAASRLEAEPGRKDPAKVTAYVAAARGALGS